MTSGGNKYLGGKNPISEMGEGEGEGLFILRGG